MPLPLDGYSTCRVLRSSARKRVYEVERDSDHRRAVAKVFRTDEAGVEARVRHEFRLLEALDVQGVVRALALERVGDTMVLLLDYVDGENLREHVRGEALPVSLFLPIATRLVGILALVHDRGIVHRDIKPSNILIERGTGAVYLADFGISVLLEGDRRHINEPEILQGTLPYLSPEQTGRTRRSVDFRSDLYSLGVTFYELLTGRRPVDGSTPLELVHAHLARQPTPLRTLRPELPEQLSAIVMKLLEKAPECRYQSARGLLADLEQFERGLAQVEPAQPFALGQFDHAATLQFPRQLYGREREIEALVAELHTTIGAHERRLVCIDGAPGLGKSALIRSLEIPLAAVGGYFAFGSFEPNASGSLYTGLIQAFEGMVEQILTEDDASLERWRRRLLEALGPVAGVVGILVPTLALVLGELPVAPTLPPAEARNRLHLAFARLLAGFAEAAPLVFVFDDAQWADAASIELLSALVLDDGPPVLFVLARRPERPGRSDAIDALLHELEQAKRPVLRMPLEPPTAEHIEALLSDVLGRKPSELAALPRLVGRKTGNNPLLVRQFLVHLASLRLLEPSAEGWVWDAQGIASASIPDDALGMLEARLDRLPERTHQLLCCAAHIGARFETEVLAAVCELDGDALGEGLYTLEAEGLIDPIPRGHCFAHEQLRVAARQLAEPDASEALHVRIARHLLDRLCPESLGERVFEVVDQLVAGYADRELSGGERLELAGLAAAAGQRALESGAWSVARRYFGEAVDRLGPELAAAEAGEDRGPLSFAVSFGHAQALALTDEIDEAEARFEALLRWRLDLVAYGEVVARRVDLLLLRHRLDEAVDAGLAGLRRCGIELPERCSIVRVITSVMSAWRRCRSVTLEQWLARSATEDPRLIAAARIIDALKAAAYLRDKNLFVVLSAMHVQVAAGERLGPLAAVAMSQLAIVASAALRKPDAAGRLCDHALAVNELPFTLDARARVESAAFLFVWPASRPWRGYANRVPGLVARLCEAGARELGGFSIVIGLALLFEASSHLAVVIEQGRAWQAEVDQWGSAEMRQGCAKTVRLAALLRGEPASDGGVRGIDSLISSEQSKAIGSSPVSQTTTMTCRMAAHTLLGRPAQGYADLEEVVDNFERSLFGTWQAARFAMWAAVVDGARYFELSNQAGAQAGTKPERRKILARMGRYLRVLRRWAAGSPDNFGAMLEIANAEYERIRGRDGQALAAYERARTQAAAQANAQLEGLACLRMAELAEQTGRTVEAHGARELALQAFRRWGAKAVVEQIEAGLGLQPGDSLTGDGLEPRELFSSTVSPGTPSVSSLSSSTPPAILDLATVVETMNLISEDLNLAEVVGRVLDSAVTSAGADRGVLLLERGEQIGVIAEADGERTRSRAEPIPLATMHEQLPMAAINYVLRTGAPLVLDDALADARFAADPYIAREGVRSLLCMPIVKHHRRVGALLLENRLTSHGFPSERLELLRFLIAQAASALDNAQLYDALQRSEARWRSLVSGAPDTILVLDTEGRIEFINHGLADPHSPQAGLVGQSVDALLDPSFHEAWRQTLAEVVERGQTGEVELCLRADEGERRWFMVRVAPVDTIGSKLLVIATDISERKALEAQVRQHQRLESIGTLASGVAHEINNPIQGIMNYAELIVGRAEGDAVVRDFATEITFESERVAAIVRDLLAFSRQEGDAALEWVAPHTLVTSTLSLIQALMRKDGVRLEVDVPALLPRVRCRPQQIRQIIMNLVTNARDALNERYGGFDERKRIDIRALEVGFEGGAWLRVEVEDQGGGIPEPSLARIFDPFFTTKGRDKGTGLGLAVSHGIAVEHGGRLTVESERGVGTVFQLWLPIEAEESVDAT